MRYDETWNAAGELISRVEVPDAGIVALPPEDFAAMFTDAELAAVQTSTDARVIRLRTKLQTKRDDVQMKSPELSGGLALLVALGILTAERREAIAAGERP